MKPDSPEFSDRVSDQEVYARCLVAGTYPEGRLQVGQTFRVGFTSDGVRIAQVAYPAVRMELLRSRKQAERVEGPDTNSPVRGYPVMDFDAVLKEYQVKRAEKPATGNPPAVTEEEKDNADRSLPDADGGSDPVSDQLGKGKKRSRD